MDLATKVFHSISKEKQTKLADTVIVGVSGGPDSVALLDVLVHVRHRLGIKLHVAHFNHRLRRGSNADEAFVRDLAARYHLPISVHRRKGILKSTVASEDQARQWRFEFFLKIARTQKAQAVALAHTQNDLAETVLMRLLRGSGLQGLRGILSGHQMGGVKFIRPFLSTQRSDIEQYLKAHGLKFCTDETNQQTYYLRNKIRLKLLPALIKEYNSNLSNVLVDLARTSQADFDYLLKQAQERFKRVDTSKTKVKIALHYFLKQDLSMQRMLLRLAFEHLAGDFYQLSFAHIQEVEDVLAEAPAGTAVHWPQRIKVVKLKETLTLQRT